MGATTRRKSPLGKFSLTEVDAFGLAQTGLGAISRSYLRITVKSVISRDQPAYFGYKC